MPRSRTILIADDDEHLVELLALRCRQLGLRVLIAEDAQSALRVLQREFVDVAVLDVCMPNGNGLDAYQMLLSDPMFHKMPTIIMTGRSDLHTIRRCHRLVAYYVQKGPEVWPRIESLLREWLTLPDSTPPDISPLSPCVAGR